MNLNTDHLKRCIETLKQSITLLMQKSPESIEYEIYRNATIKGYELTLETAGKLLKKAIKPYFSNPKEVEQLVFKDIFRHGAKHGFLTIEEATRWFTYRDNRNNTAHDYGLGSVDNSSSEGLRPATCSRDPEILLNAQHYCTEIDQAGSREQVAGRRDSNCQQTLGFAEETLKLLPKFVEDAQRLKEALDHARA